MPDSSKYQFDKNSGYQYDPSTGLYYDPSSQYYYNSVIQKYLYWDPEKLTYVLAPGGEDHKRMSMAAATATSTVAPAAVAPTESQGSNEPKKVKPEKQDKVKVGRKIVKDMERWAKTLNQKKENTLSRTSTENTMMHFSNLMASADIGFAVLEKKNGGTSMIPLMKNELPLTPSHIPPQPQIQQLQQQQQQQQQLGNGGPGAPPLVAAYGESDESADEDLMDDTDFLDFSRLICNLCKRQLGSKDALAKHAKLSTLHKQNMEMRKAQRISEGKIKYRDRARERRLKYGESDDPTPSKLKEKYLKSREAPESGSQPSNLAAEPIGSENVGNRLLQKMGWTEGQGLGKSNQGRTSIIQAEQRNSTVGLGNKMATYTAMPGETYKDCVKKMMYARYQELSERN